MGLLRGGALDLPGLIPELSPAPLSLHPHPSISPRCPPPLHLPCIPKSQMLFPKRGLAPPSSQAKLQTPSAIPSPKETASPAS